MKSLAVVIAVCASSVAHADSRAWTAARKVLPAGLEVVAGANVTSIRSTKLFAQLWPLVAQKSPQTASMFDQVKATCGFDALSQIDSFVLAGSVDDDDSSVFVLSLRSPEKQIEDCLVKVDKALGKTFTIGKEGPYVKYNEGGGDAYVRWLDSKTVAVALRASDKDFLAKMLAGGIARDPAVSRIKSNAAMWVVYNKPADLDPLGTKMARAYGAADVKSGTVAIDAHLVLPDAASAKAAATKASDQLAAAKASGQLPDKIAMLVRSVAITSAGPELVVTASGTEDDVLDLVKLAAQ